MKGNGVGDLVRWVESDGYAQKARGNGEPKRQQFMRDGVIQNDMSPLGLIDHDNPESFQALHAFHLDGLDAGVILMGYQPILYACRHGEWSINGLVQSLQGLPLFAQITYRQVQDMRADTLPRLLEKVAPVLRAALKS